MYRVVTIALSRDGRQAGRPFGTVDRGELSSGELLELLRGFEKATSADREEAEIRISSPDNSGVVRSVNGQLLLRSSREAHLREHPLGPMDIVEHLDRSTTWTPFHPKPEEAPPPSPPKPAAARPPLREPTLLGLAVSLLAFLGGAVGLCVAVRVALRKPPVDPVPVLSNFQEASEKAAISRNVVGLYSTGPGVGDRTITVRAGGALEFDTIGAKGAIDQVIDTYAVGLRQETPCLATGHNGLIELQGSDTLVYCRDLYHRLP